MEKEPETEREAAEVAVAVAVAVVVVVAVVQSLLKFNHLVVSRLRWMREGRACGRGRRCPERRYPKTCSKDTASPTDLFAASTRIAK